MLVPTNWRNPYFRKVVFATSWWARHYVSYHADCFIDIFVFEWQLWAGSKHWRDSIEISVLWRYSSYGGVCLKRDVNSCRVLQNSFARQCCTTLLWTENKSLHLQHCCGAFCTAEYTTTCCRQLQHRVAINILVECATVRLQALQRYGPYRGGLQCIFNPFVLCCSFLGRPVDLIRSRTRTNIPVQKILEAQNLSSSPNSVEINLHGDEPSRPRRTKRAERKSDEQLESDAQDILDKLKNLWAVKREKEKT